MNHIVPGVGGEGVGRCPGPRVRGELELALPREPRGGHSLTLVLPERRAGHLLCGGPSSSCHSLCCWKGGGQVCWGRSWAGMVTALEGGHGPAGLPGDAWGLGRCLQLAAISVLSGSCPWMQRLPRGPEPDSGSDNPRGAMSPGFLSLLTRGLALGGVEMVAMPPGVSPWGSQAIAQWDGCLRWGC